MRIWGTEQDIGPIESRITRSGLVERPDRWRSLGENTIDAGPLPPLTVPLLFKPLVLQRQIVIFRASLRKLGAATVDDLGLCGLKRIMQQPRAIA